MKISLVRLLICLALLGILGQFALAQAPMPLEFKFTQGQNLNYLATFNATGSMLMQPAPAQMPNMTMSLQGNMDFSQQVTQVYPDGSADLSLRLPRAALNMSAMGQQFNVLLQSGKINLTVNGQPQQTPPDANLSQFPLIGVPLKMRMDKLGKVTDFSLPNFGALTEIMKSSGMDMSSMMKFSQNQLPDHPVAVGDSWIQNIALPMVPGSPPLQIKTVNTLLGFEGVGGQQTAKIQIKGTAAACNLKMPTPAMPGGGQNMPKIDTTIESLNMDMEGLVWFAPQLGQMMKSQQTMTMKEVISISGMPDKGPQKSIMDMRMNISMFLK